jgi:RNA polymerase sigma factor (sigma-70 family)
MMKELAVAVGTTHPLVADRARLEKITDNMYAQIHRVIHGIGRDPRTERTLHGGQSADDVLQEALIALLEYDVAKLRTTWEALSVGIARKKAFAALRRATRGRRSSVTGRGEPDDVTVVPLEAAGTDPRDDSADPELVYERTQQQLVLLRLAKKILSDRERTVFLAIHFDGLTRAELAETVGLTPQGVGQMYTRALKSLYGAARADRDFPTTAGLGGSAP